MEQIGDYRIERLIVEGNSGSLYVAEPPARLGRAGQRVALKVLAGYGDDEAYRRVVDELSRFAASGAPSLIPLYDVGHQEGTIFYSTELVAHGSLASPDRELSRVEQLRAVATAARAAHGLHEAGIAHQGIKPSSILLGDDGTKLAEPSLASVVAPGQTITGLDLGAVEYLDPRVLAGEPPGRAGDVWAFGVTLHVILTGETVYPNVPDDGVMAVLRHVTSNDPVVSSRLDPAERELVTWCLAEKRSSRPLTALALADAIDRMSPVADPAGAGT